MKQNNLSLDFWQDTVIYGDKSFPSGTLGCDALNIPTKVIEQLNSLCIALNLLMGRSTRFLHLIVVGLVHI